MNEAESGAETHSNPGALIHVVDDEPMLLELSAAILEGEGYRVRTFRDPSAELQLFSTTASRPDVLITDYEMGGMNGMELIRHVRQLHPRQKILLISGTVAEDIFADSEVKPDQFLAKPFKVAQLTQIVKELLAAR